MSAPRLPDDQLSPNALAQRKYRANSAKRHKALIRNKIHHALKMGRLVKLPCLCGELTVEAHHYQGYDLEHALDVVWLCKKHHGAIHRAMNRRADAA